MAHKFQTVILALMLVLASSYCAAQCVVGPCHQTRSAKQPAPPPCHQHSQEEQQQPDDATPSCLHSQLVMDSQPVIHLTGDLVPVAMVAILPADFTLAPVVERIDAVALHTGPPPPWPSLVLSTSLRI